MQGNVRSWVHMAWNPWILVRYVSTVTIFVKILRTLNSFLALFSGQSMNMRPYEFRASNQSCSRNFTEFKTSVHLETNTKQLDSEVKCQGQETHLVPFCRHRILDDVCVN